jgi:hypothetical protein
VVGCAFSPLLKIFNRVLGGGFYPQFTMKIVGLIREIFMPLLLKLASSALPVRSLSVVSGSGGFEPCRVRTTQWTWSFNPIKVKVPCPFFAKKARK